MSKDKDKSTDESYGRSKPIKINLSKRAKGRHQRKVVRPKIVKAIKKLTDDGHDIND